MEKSELFENKLKVLQGKLEKEKNSIAEIKILFNELEEILFKKNCLKSYLKECEPFYCGFRYTNECKYLDDLSVLYRLKEQYKL